METQEQCKRTGKAEVFRKLPYRIKKPTKAPAVVLAVAAQKCITLWLMIIHNWKVIILMLIWA